MSGINKRQLAKDLIVDYFKLEGINDTRTVVDRKNQYLNHIDTEELDSSFIDSEFVIENPLFVVLKELSDYIINVSRERYKVSLSKNTILYALEELESSRNSVFYSYTLKQIDKVENTDDVTFKLYQLFKKNTSYTNFKLIAINAEVLSDDLTKCNEYKDLYNKVDDFLSDSFNLININKKYKDINLSKEQLDSLFKVHNLLMDVKKELLTMESNK